jgi:3-hydroxy-5-phosphonooxypentane-2,4-dione thiolase
LKGLLKDSQRKKETKFSMADLDDLQDGKNYHIGVPMPNQPFFLKGSNSLDWGMKNRLAQIFNPSSGRTVMLAVDHGYFQGPTTGLERIDLSIVPLIPYADALMITRGALRSSIPADISKPVVLRASGGQSILKELSNELVAVEIDDVVRVNAAAMAVQVYIGGEHEHQSIGNLTKIVDVGNRFNIPTLAVTGVGKELVRDAKYLGLATRICAEMGAHFVKTYYCERGFARVTAACPVPVLIAGGKKLPEMDALKMAYQAIDEGAAGVDMGRNVFQCEAPAAMIQAVRAVVHEHQTPQRAYELYQSLKNEDAVSTGGRHAR